MKKLPTVKIGGKTAFVIDRTHIEDDIAAAEAISRDAARYRWLKDHLSGDSFIVYEGRDWVTGEIESLDRFIDERI